MLLASGKFEDSLAEALKSFGACFGRVSRATKPTFTLRHKPREQVAVGPGFLKHHILYILCIG